MTVPDRSIILHVHEILQKLFFDIKKKIEFLIKKSLYDIREHLKNIKTAPHSNTLNMIDRQNQKFSRGGGVVQLCTVGLIIVDFIKIKW